MGYIKHTCCIIKIIAMCLFIGFISGCGSEKPNKSKKKNSFLLNMLKEGLELDKQKKYYEAAKIFEGLKPFNKTPDFIELKIEKYLEQGGWSIGSLGTSATLKTISDIQNQINSYAKKYKRFPDVEVEMTIPTDYWGNDMTFAREYSKSKRKTFDYSIDSMGADGISDTDDDIRILNKVPNLVDQDDGHSKGFKQKKLANEKMMDLDELIKQNKEGS